MQLELDKKKGFRAKAKEWFTHVKDRGVKGTLQTARVDVKEFWNKTEKIQVATNLETPIDSYTSHIEFWIDGHIFRKYIHPSGKHTLSIKIEATQKDGDAAFAKIEKTGSFELKNAMVTKGAIM
ncbi:MAG: hypothetical protein H7249_04670 [Chitinophagaceae bacterium]|nr:hypothetical protein [Oligoflexus sp.]